MGCGRRRFVESALSDICHTRCSITMAAKRSFPAQPPQASHQPSPPLITWLDSLIWLFPEENPPSSSGCWSPASPPPAERHCLSGAEWKWKNVLLPHHISSIRFIFFSRLPCVVYSFLILFFYFVVCISGSESAAARKKERKKERKKVSALWTLCFAIREF